jgi:hypothetical protein
MKTQEKSSKRKIEREERDRERDFIFNYEGAFL